jgi:hypothetical protein
MQPNTDSTAPLTDPVVTRRRRRPTAALAATALVVGGLLAACGGGSSGSDAADSSSDTSAPADGTGSADAGEGTTTLAGTPDLDICAEVTEEEVAAILPEAELVDVSPNDVVPTPNCRYQISIGGGAMNAAVVSIDWNEPGFFDGQKELQSSETDLTELDADAFILEEGSLMVFVRGQSGTFLIAQGVELTEGGELASRDQLIAIAELVQDL